MTSGQPIPAASGGSLAELSALIQSQRYADAAAVIEKLEAILPPSIDLIYSRAIVRMHLGQFREALGDAITVVRNEPNNAAAHRLIELLHSQIAAQPAQTPDSLLTFKPNYTAEQFIRDNPTAGRVTSLQQYSRASDGWSPSVTVVKNGLLLGRHGVLAAPDGTMLRESTMYCLMDKAFESIPGSGYQSNSIIDLAGRFVPLCGIWCEAFWHFFTEQVARVVLAIESGFDGFFVVEPGRSYIYELLRLLGVSGERIVDWDGGNYRISELTIPSLWQNQFFDAHPALLAKIRETLRVAAGVSDTASRRRIYLKRTQPHKGRCVINDAEVEALLASYGFESINAENLSLVDQIRLFSSAEALVGPHGAGFAHSLFMPRGSLVAEFFSQHYINVCNLPAHRFLNQRYHMLVHETPLTRGADRNDISVNMDMLRQILAQAFPAAIRGPTTAEGLKRAVTTARTEAAARRARFGAPDLNAISDSHRPIDADAVQESLTRGWKHDLIPMRQRALVEQELAALYAGKPPRVYTSMAEAVGPYLKDNELMLEVGCSSGYYAEALSHLLAKPFGYIGVDYSAPMIQLAREIYREIPFFVCDGARLPFADRSIPIVISSCVILHTPNYAEQIREAARVCSRALVLHRTPVCRRRQTSYMSKRAYGIETVELLFSENEILELLRQQGLRVDHTIEIESNPADDTYCVTYACSGEGTRFS